MPARSRQIQVRAQEEIPPGTCQVSVGEILVGAEVLVVAGRGGRIKVREVPIAVPAASTGVEEVPIAVAIAGEVIDVVVVIEVEVEVEVLGVTDR